ncbi:hypothetical protein [Chryseobacterium sp.]|uniref:hypothetical protein n=1 Tax=Chryseobacterium sp. TaxID=1871047 RepID=UPI003340AAF0
MKNTFYYVKNKDSNYLLDNFPSDFKYLIHTDINSRNRIDLAFGKETIKARIGKHCCSDLEIIILTFDEKYTNRYKFFKELLDVSPLLITPILELQDSVTKQNQESYDEFVHNITSLNSYSIQNLFSLIPQELLSNNINKQKEIIKEIIKEKPNLTVDALLKQIKYSVATKVEFSAYESIVKNNNTLLKQKHKIHKVILSILQIFIDDFEKNKITVSLSASEKLLEIDYDSIFVSLYYIFDNALKYCCPNTDFKIILSEEPQSFDIIFKMVSVKIDDNEIDLLTERGYRSKTAKAVNTQGKGIGMYRIMKTLKYNNAELKITPNSFKFNKTTQNIEYQGNEFRVIFKNQNDWFKR